MVALTMGKPGPTPVACIINLTIINDDCRVINKLETSVTDGTRVSIYDCHMFIVQATDWDFVFRELLLKWRALYGSPSH